MRLSQYDCGPMVVDARSPAGPRLVLGLSLPQDTLPIYEVLWKWEDSHYSAKKTPLRSTGLNLRTHHLVPYLRLPTWTT